MLNFVLWSSGSMEKLTQIAHWYLVIIFIVIIGHRYRHKDYNIAKLVMSAMFVHII